MQVEVQAHGKGEASDSSSSENTTQENEKAYSFETEEATHVDGHAQKQNATSPFPFWLLLEERWSPPALDHFGYPNGDPKLYKGEFEVAAIVPLDANDAAGQVHRHLKQRPSLEGQLIVAVQCEATLDGSGIALEGFSEIDFRDAARALNEGRTKFGRKDIGAGFLEAMKFPNVFIAATQSMPKELRWTTETLQAAFATFRYNSLRQIRKIVSLKYAAGDHMREPGCCKGFYLNGNYGTETTWSSCYKNFIQNTNTHHWIPGGCIRNYLEYWNGGTFQGPKVQRGDSYMSGFIDSRPFAADGK